MARIISVAAPDPVPDRKEEIRAMAFRHRPDCRGGIVFTRCWDKHLSRAERRAG